MIVRNIFAVMLMMSILTARGDIITCGAEDTMRAEEFCLAPRAMIQAEELKMGIARRLKNPYGDLGVRREFEDLDDIFTNKISKRIREGLRNATEPLKILLIGGGEMTELQIRAGYSEAVQDRKLKIFSFAKENLVPEVSQGFISGSFVLGDMDNGLPFQENQFDVVIVADVVAPYFKDKFAALHEIQRVLNDTGHAFVADFGLTVGQDGQGIRDITAFSGIERESRTLLRDNDNNDWETFNIMFEKNTPIPRLNFLHYKGILNIGEVTKFISIYDVGLFEIERAI